MTNEKIFKYCYCSQLFQLSCGRYLVGLGSTRNCFESCCNSFNRTGGFNDVQIGLVWIAVMMNKRMKILDVCCGSKMFWYDKQEPHTTYMDIRKAVYTAIDRGNERKIEINPDIQADWKNIPFDDETFDLVIFDPPHLVRAGKTSWLAKKYGTIDLMTWPNEFHKAFQEIMRVLKPTGTMIFKWNEDQIPIKEVFKAFGQQPILGDMCSKTKWSVFIKEDER